MRLYFYFAGMAHTVSDVLSFESTGAYVRWGGNNLAFVPYRDLYITL